MSQAYRNLQETQLLAIRSLERRVANLERAAAGSASIDVTSTGDLILAAGIADVTGASITISQAGRYLLLGTWDLSTTVAGAGVVFLGNFAVTGSGTLGTSHRAARGLDVVERISCSAFAYATFTGAGTAKLQAQKNGAGGTATVLFGASITALTAIRMGPT